MEILPVVHILDREQAVKEAQLLLATPGVNGLFFINHNDNDSLTVALTEQFIRSHPQHRIGMNLLSHDAGDALRIALDKGINNLWIDSVGINTQLSPEYALQGFLSAQRQARKGTNLNIFGGVAFKYQLNEPDPEGATRLALKYSIIPTTSGRGTGVAADFDKIKAMGAVAPNQLAVASGLTPENIAEYAPHIQYALVATGISKDEHHVDTDKLKAFIEAVPKSKNTPPLPF